MLKLFLNEKKINEKATKIDRKRNKIGPSHDNEIAYIATAAKQL